MPHPELITDRDGIVRCGWCGDDPEYVRYHDEEWGRPVTDDHRLFEKLCLEGFQAGLSWITVLRKRPAFREVFEGFDPEIVAGFSEETVERLLHDERIIRHRKKIESAINNAQRTLELLDEVGTLKEYLWRWVEFRDYPGNVAINAKSHDLARDLKRRGFSFLGPTTMYALMQSVGIVNDHHHGCQFRDPVEGQRLHTIEPRVAEGP